MNVIEKERNELKEKEMNYNENDN